MSPLLQDLQFSVRRYTTLPSTNDEAMRLAHDSAPEGAVVVCDRQTAGRGQRDNVWESRANENLTMSLILRPKLAVGKLFLISKAFSVAVVKTLQRCNIAASIKWPNDIYVGERKIAGILIEHSFCGTTLDFSIVGLGLNVNQTVFPAMNHTPTSIFLETGKSGKIDKVMNGVLNDFRLLYRALNVGSKNAVNDEYINRLYRRRGFYPYRDNSGTVFNAEIHAIADSGELTLHLENGEYRNFRFKETTAL